MKIMTDLHLHSCLSPCGDDDMTPYDLVGMSLLAGRQLIALTDHNTARNCPAAASAAAGYGIVFIPGIEVTTSEDIHAICLFPDLDAAMEFGRFLYGHLPDIPNRPEIFGQQIICNREGSPCGTESRLLIAGSDISILDLPGIAAGYGAICYPAHIDREGSGLLSSLGAWPAELDVHAAEVRGELKVESGEWRVESGGLGFLIPGGLKIIRASDAHSLRGIPDKGFPIELESIDFTALAAWIRSDAELHDTPL